MSALTALQQKVWAGALPLEIRLSHLDCHSYDDSPSYYTQKPRLSYLPPLLPTLHAFFKPHLINPDFPFSKAWFSLDSVPLKHHHPLGLLYDLLGTHEPFTPDPPTGLPLQPWKLTVHFSDPPDGVLIPLDAEGKVLEDAFFNAVKEADFLRNGTAKAIMGLSKEDSAALWAAVLAADRASFMSVHRRLLDVPGVKLRHVPLRVYLPLPATEGPASMRMVQGLVAAEGERGQKMTLGVALNALLPSVFPSARRYIHAQAVLHGAVVPMGAVVEELMRAAAYADGWVHLAVVMFG